MEIIRTGYRRGNKVHAGPLNIFKRKTGFLVKLKKKHHSHLGTDLVAALTGLDVNNFTHLGN